MYAGGNSAASLDVTEVRVVAAGEEPGTQASAGEVLAGEVVNFNGTAGMWRIKAIADGGGWQARWLDRPTWDHTVTPNVIKRTGGRTPGGRRRR